MQYAWLTDPHFDFLNPSTISQFAREVSEAEVEGLFITGDIAVASQLEQLLTGLDKFLPFPIYFVLGNHDYYGSSIAATRAHMADFSERKDSVKWMPEIGIVSLSDTTALIGHGGWGDGRIGDFMSSGIMLNDYVRIKELCGLPKAKLMERLNELGMEAADFLEDRLLEAFDTHDEVILLTHVPPFLEASWHEGKTVLNEWTPHFTCGAVGERLSDTMLAHPDKVLTVLCGHTHGEGRAEMLPNLVVLTGGAVYGAPALQPHIDVQ